MIKSISEPDKYDSNFWLKNGKQQKQKCTKKKQPQNKTKTCLCYLCFIIFYFLFVCFRWSYIISVEMAIWLQYSGHKRETFNIKSK